jgi:opacity protein-like surface antigen
MRAGTGLIAATLLAGTALLPAAPASAQDNGYGYEFHEGLGTPSTPAKTDVSDPTYGGLITRSGPDDGPAAAGIGGYVALRGSLAFSDHLNSNMPTTPATAMHAGYHVGGGGSLVAGAHLPYGFKVEFEGLYRYQPLNYVSLAGTATPAHGQAQIGAPMFNLLWDIPIPGFPLRPFVGAGVGAAYVATDIRDPANLNTYYKSDKWALAYQFMGGAEIPLSPSSRFTAMYRWLQIDSLTGACGASGPASLSCKAGINSQSVDLGLEMDL